MTVKQIYLTGAIVLSLALLLILTDGYREVGNVKTVLSIQKLDIPWWVYNSEVRTVVELQSGELVEVYDIPSEGDKVCKYIVGRHGNEHYFICNEWVFLRD